MKKIGKSLAILVCVSTVLSSVFTPALSLSAEDTGESYHIEGYVSPDFNLTGLNSRELKSGFVVSIEGTNQRAVTDADGYFKLQTASAGSNPLNLLISKESYITRQIAQVPSGVILGSSKQPVDMWAGDIPLENVQDNVINMNDIVQIVKVYNSAKGDAKFNTACDVNKDEIINMNDIVIAATHFGKTGKDYPEYKVVPANSPAPTFTPTLSPTPTSSSISLDASIYPPFGINPWEVPMFVCIGSEDNSDPNSVNWFSSLVASRKNPSGTSFKTYDGQNCSLTFFCCGQYSGTAGTSWSNAFRLGHEIADHSFSHTTNTKTSTAVWNDEIKKKQRCPYFPGYPGRSDCGLQGALL